MVKQHRFFLVFLFCIVAHSATSSPVWHEQVMNWPAVGAPMINFSPETNWVFGGGVQGYFLCPGQTRTSMVQLSGAYSLRSQWYIQTKGDLYVGVKRSWVVSYNVDYRKYPDLYFEAGNRFEIKQSTPYLARRVNVRANALASLANDWYAGPVVHYLYEQSDKFPRLSIAGAGLTLRYDSRDVHFYPNSGLFFQMAAMHYESFNQSYSRAETVDLDLRHFVPIYQGVVFAWQFRTRWTFGSQLPLLLQASLGGEDLIRGVRYGMFRDQVMLALQGELRVPIFRQLSGTVFAGVGDVYHYQPWQWSTPKVGYGLGLRFSVNRARVNIRADVARNNLYKSWNTWESYSFYLTATEAF